MRTATHPTQRTTELDLVFKALASDQRREILRLLGERAPGDPSCCDAADDVCACRLSERLGLSASTISHHMAVLRDAGLVTARKDGLWVHYGLRREVLERAAAELRLY